MGHSKYTTTHALHALKQMRSCTVYIARPYRPRCSMGHSNYAAYCCVFACA